MAMPSGEEWKENQDQFTASMVTFTPSVRASEISKETHSVVSQPKEMRGTRTDFVIPKNKLSGALVPVTRASKWEPIEPKTEHFPKLEHLSSSLSRKTKWAPDLSEDPDVKRRRALALQVSITLGWFISCICSHYNESHSFGDI